MCVCRKAAATAKCVETPLALPSANFADAALSIQVIMPGTAVAGEALPLRLALQNRTPLPQRFTVAVGDASGFVLAGGVANKIAQLFDNCFTSYNGQQHAALAA